MLPWRALTLLLAFGLPVRPRLTNSQSAARDPPQVGLLQSIVSFTLV